MNKKEQELQSEKNKLLKSNKSQFSVFEFESQKKFFLDFELKKLEKSPLKTRNQITISKVILAQSKKVPATTDNLLKVYP